MKSLENLVRIMESDLDESTFPDTFYISYRGRRVTVPCNPTTFGNLEEFIGELMEHMENDFADRLSRFIGEPKHAIYGFVFSPENIAEHLKPGDGVAAAIAMWLYQYAEHGPEEEEEEARGLLRELEAFLSE